MEPNVEDYRKLFTKKIDQLNSFDNIQLAIYNQLVEINHSLFEILQRMKVESE